MFNIPDNTTGASDETCARRRRVPRPRKSWDSACVLGAYMHPPVQTEPTSHREVGVSGPDNRGLVDGALPVGRQRVKTVSRQPWWEVFPGPYVFSEARGFVLVLSLAAGPGHGAFSSGLARQGTMGLTLCKKAWPGLQCCCGDWRMGCYYQGTKRWRAHQRHSELSQEQSGYCGHWGRDMVQLVPRGLQCSL